MLFVLNRLAELDDGELVGVFDTDQVGVLGVSLGGYTTVAMTGVYIDPTYLQDWCAEMGEDDINHELCEVTHHWDTFAEYIAPVGLEADAPWPPFSDNRIKAAVALDPWGGPLFGAEGLRAATVPTLFMGTTQNQRAVYARDAVFTFTHFGAEERYLLSFIGAEHHDILLPGLSPLALHFATAFFGDHLQGQEDYAEYLTEEYVEQFEDLAWGPYQSE
jgi:predicted dienelactone hydrolase